MTNELMTAARMARNGSQGLVDRDIRRGRRCTYFAEPAAPSVVVVVGDHDLPSDEFESFVIRADQPDENISRAFKNEISKYEQPA